MNSDSSVALEIVVEGYLPHEFEEFYRSHTTEAERAAAGPITISGAPVTPSLADNWEIATKILLMFSSGALPLIGKVLLEWIRARRTIFHIKGTNSTEADFSGPISENIEKSLTAFLDGMAASGQGPQGQSGGSGKETDLTKKSVSVQVGAAKVRAGQEAGTSEGDSSPAR